MISMFRTTALAAALAIGSFGAQAAAVPINLDKLGLDAANAKAPVAVGTLQGFVFSDNAFAYRADMLNYDVQKPPTDVQTPANTAGSFILNGDRTTGTVGGPAVASLSISLGQGFKDAGQYFQSISLSVFSKGAMTISWFDKGGNVARSLPLTNPLDTIWNPFTKGTDWSATEQVDRIEFSASDNAFFGLQSLSIGLTDATRPQPNPAPEPASYALVGLALLAAGAATRRRA